jgi:DNA-binding beta-propeller fold protein YncE
VDPLDVYVSELNGAIYVSDFGNNKIQRWDINATQGITVAGNPAGSPGVTPDSLNGPFTIAFDPNNETFLYASDHNNHRVVQFTLS